MQTVLEAALAPVIMALEADGYGAVVVEKPGVISIKIFAGPDVCEECLSPRKVLEPMIVHMLRQNGMDHELELSYPDEP
jgi:hypothetical protein